MAKPAMARDAVRTLRHQIARMEGRLAEQLDLPGAAGPATAMLTTGAARLDAALGGGLPAAGLTDIHSAITRNAGAATGFALAMMSRAAAGKGMVAWIGTGEIFREAGHPYAPGIAERFGILPENLLLGETERLADVLWIAEEAAALGPLAGILLELGGSPPMLDLKTTQRLHRRALAASHPLFLLRQAAPAEPTAAPVRLIVAPLAAASRLTLRGPLHGSIGPPGFRVSVDKSRVSPPATFNLEWNLQTRSFEERDHVSAATDSVALAAAAADGSHSSPAFREVVALVPSPGGGALGGQPPGEQHPAHRRARHRR